MKAEEIADQLRSRIECGELAPGDRVPSARAIRAEWNVAIATASRVHALLRAAGLAESRPGVGVVVTAQRAPSAPPVRLQPDTLVTTAVGVADAEGLEAVSFRRLATELGVAPMSLYRLVADKDDLVTRMLDAVLREWQPPRSGEADWRERVEAGARGMWTVLRRHPWAGGALSLSRPQVVEAGIGWTEWMLESLRGGGLDVRGAFDMHLALFSFTRGLAIGLEAESAASASTGVDAEHWVEDRMDDLRSLTAARPHFARLVQEDYDFSFDRVFESGLRTILDGLRRPAEPAALS